MDDDDLIKLLKDNLSRFACLGINTLVNDIIPTDNQRVINVNHNAPVPDSPDSPNYQGPPGPPDHASLRRRNVDPGIRVSGVSGVSDESAGIRVSGNDNINRSYVHDYLESSGCLPENITDHQAFDGEACCVVCEDNAAIIMFMPCNHLAYCKQCSELLNECSLCKQKIDHKIRVYPSK